MKNLPNKFPIRYAIILASESDREDYLGLQKNTEANLYNDVIELLKENILNKEIVNINYSFIKFSFNKNKLFELAKLETNIDWKTIDNDFCKMENLLKKIYPNKKIVKEMGIGNLFKIGFYSYKGASERPCFLRSYNAALKKDLLWKKGVANSVNIEYFGELYKKIVNNQISEVKLDEDLGHFEKPIYITAKYSKLWDKLDKGEHDGIIPPERMDPDFLSDISYKNDGKKIESHKNKKIKIVICKNWDSLFAEEIRSLYKTFSFCNNCGKPLSFDWKGIYCPDTKENKACIRERARNRKKIHK
jgi:hypothetical protein